MATTKLSDEALVAFFQSRPELRERIESIVGAVCSRFGMLASPGDIVAGFTPVAGRALLFQRSVLPALSRTL